MAVKQSESNDTLPLESRLQIIRLWDFVNQSRFYYQCEYEENTNNGVNLSEQIVWEQQIQNDLKNS